MSTIVGQSQMKQRFSFGRILLRLLALAGVVFLSLPATAETKLDSEVYCLALNIYFEARNESEEGKRAVGHVVMNRVAHPRFPKSVCKVVRQGGEIRRNRCQFSWWCDGRSDRPRNREAWSESVHLAYQVYVGHSVDPTRGALWYHADYVKPSWGKVFKPVRKIGQHIFYQRNTTNRDKPGAVQISYGG